MKQMKLFAMCVMTAVMSVVLASCMNGENSSTYTGSAIVKYNYSSFVAGDGTKLIPTTDVGALLGTYYLIYFQYDQTQVTSTGTPITLLSTPVSVDPKSNERLTTVKTTPTNPLYSLDKNYFGCSYFDENTVVLSIPYWVKASGSTIDQTDVSKHSFILSFDPDAIQTTDDKLTFYISHVVEDGETTTRSASTWAYRVFGISSALSQFQAKTGKAPTALVFKAETNSSQDKIMESGGENSVEFTYTTTE